MALQVGLTLEITIAGIAVTKIGFAIGLSRHAGTVRINGGPNTRTTRALVACRTGLTVIAWVRVVGMRTALSENTKVGRAYVVVVA